MGYLVTQIIICLLIAALIGFIIGWLLKGLAANNKQQIYQGVGSDSGAAESNFDNFSQANTETDDIFIEPVTKAPVKSHQIEHIVGIDKSLRKILNKIGVKTTRDLIEKSASESGFQQVLSKTNVDDAIVNHWVSMADLMRVPGVEGHYAELIEAVGIKSVQDLTKSDAKALNSKLQIVNQSKQMLPANLKVPEVNTVAHWIKDAKTLPIKKI